MFYKVVTASRSSALSEGLTYEGPDGIAIGSPVRVPLRSKIIEGIVSEILQKREDDTFDVKQIKEVLGQGAPLLGENQIKTAAWVAHEYFCSFRQALSLFLPPMPWLNVLPKAVTHFALASSTEIPKSEKQKSVIAYLSEHGETSENDLMNRIDISKAILTGLVTKGFVTAKKIVPSIDQAEAAILKELPVLTGEQEVALEALQADTRPGLLFGVTGSGKTEVYARLIAEAIKSGRQAIVLSSEIFLAEHLLPRFEKILPRSAIAVIHSKRSASEERETWRRVRRGEVSLVLGARSGIFAPFQKLGLVILDEEHEWTYKSEQTPRYHAREVAEVLCRNSGAKLVLGSATPSMETWMRAKNGQYQFTELKERYNGATMPDVKVVDLATAEFGKHYPFTRPLIDAIAERLDKKEQVVLFLNHRGSASALLCLECRRRIVSADSNLPFTVHKKSNGTPFLMDHSTGMTAPVPETCPHCGSTNMREVGAGTQKIEQSLATLFPHARVLRADSDVLRSTDDMQRMLRTLEQGEADILVGTQTVVKGLDLPLVTLAAVLVADIGMSLPHFRAGERTFQLLMQLTGRSGRARTGEVIIQTFRPDAPEVLYASKHDAAGYLNSEFKMRVAMHYPPAEQMIRLLFRGPSAKTDALRTKAELDAKAHAAGSHESITAGPTFFSGGKEWHILMRGNSVRALLQAINLKGIVVDPDPLETL